MENLDLSEERDTFGIGARIGYRISFGERTGFYVLPWIGLDWVYRGDDVAIEGSEFDHRSLRLLPTLHVGWRF